MLLSSHQFLCLLSTLSVELLLPVLSCALLLSGQGQVPQLPHITVLVAHSLLLVITYALLLKWKDPTFCTAKNKPEGKGHLGESLCQQFCG